MERKQIMFDDLSWSVVQKYSDCSGVSLSEAVRQLVMVGIVSLEKTLGELPRSGKRAQPS